MIVEVDLYYQIRTLYNEGESIRFIARRLNISSDGTKGQYTGKGADAFVSLTAMTAMNNNTAFAYESVEESNGRKVIIAVAPVTTNSGEVVGTVIVERDASKVLETTQTTSRNVIIIAVTIILLCSVVMFFITGGIAKGLRKVNRKVKDIVETDGDLTKKIKIKTNDETKDIANNINRLLDYIRTVIANISESSQMLAISAAKTNDNAGKSNKAVGNISENVMKMNDRMSAIATEIQNMESAFEHIEEYIGTLTSEVGEGTTMSTEIDKRATSLVKHAEEKTSIAKQRMADIESRLKEQLEQAKEVNNIQMLTDKILEITDETSLLALNASIEAARAGDAGRGFAVVAGEIGKLAQDSSESVQNIQKISEDILNIVGSLAKESEEMLNFLNEQIQDGYGQLLDTGKQYSTDANYIAGMMERCMNQATMITKEMNVVMELVEPLDNAITTNVESVSSISDSIEMLSNELQENKLETDHNLMISAKLDEEVQKFII